MRLYCWLFLVMSIGFMCSACGKASPPAATPTVESLRLRVGTGELTVEVARTMQEMAKGLMDRKSLPKDTGMLFVFPEPGPVSFWMKDTYVPLTVAYLDADGKILELHDLEPLNETPVPSHSMAVLYALEVPQGWFARHKTVPGSLVIPVGTSWEALKMPTSPR